jgi:hypothetical protein
MEHRATGRRHHPDGMLTAQTPDEFADLHVLIHDRSNRPHHAENNQAGI